VVIILTGVAGSGKTTIGGALAAELGWTFIDGDHYHPPGNVEQMHASVARALDRREHTVMACAALRRQQRDILRGGRPGVRFVFLEAGHLQPSQLAALEPPAADEALVVGANWPPDRILGAIRAEFGV